MKAQLIFSAIIIICLSLTAAWFLGAFDRDHEFGNRVGGKPDGYSRKCPSSFLMFNGKCDESIANDRR